MRLFSLISTSSRTTTTTEILLVLLLYPTMHVKVECRQTITHVYNTLNYHTCIHSTNIHAYRILKELLKQNAADPLQTPSASFTPHRSSTEIIEQSAPPIHHQGI